MMKHIFEFVLATIIIYFVWNILKRIFFRKFHSYLSNQNRNENRREQDFRNSDNTKKKINWDAETVDYEEVKENNNKR